MRLLDRKFIRHFWSYLLQCLMATLTVVAVLLLLDGTDQAAIVASVGASSFIVFTSPGSQPARLRSLLGGYAVGMFCGVGCTVAQAHIDPLGSWGWTGSYIVMGGAAVGASIFLMVLSDTEHPPAAAIALALVLNPWDALTLVVIAVAVGMLALVKRVFRSHLRDLI